MAPCGYNFAPLTKEISAEQQNAVIASLANDYDWVCYIDKKTCKVRNYRSSRFISEKFNDYANLESDYDKINAFFKDFVCEEDYEKFKLESDPELVDKSLLTVPSHEIYFRAKIGDDLFYYKLRFVLDQDNPDGIVMGLLSFDEQIKAQIRRQEEKRTKAMIEKQFEIMITDRTAEIQAKNKVLNRINEDIIELLGDITEARDIESGEHIKRVKGFTHILANQVMQDNPHIGLTPNMVDLITSASALHDIGKITIPDAILLKPGRLTPEEFNIMKTHSESGAELLKRAPKDWSDMYLKVGMEICRHHHEKYDGTGYPDGLKGENIPISAQIVSVADCYDALTTKRVYKDAFTPEKAFEMITNGECGVFSEMMMDSFARAKEKFFEHSRTGKLEYTLNTSLTVNYERLSGIRVLLVDDSEITRLICREMLEGEGATVIEAKSGQEAIDMFKAVVPGTFNAILMDLFMPGISGIEAAREIRSIDRPYAKSTPIIALTSSTNQVDIRDCFLSGINTYLTKPVKISSLTEAILGCLGQG